LAAEVFIEAALTATGLLGAALAAESLAAAGLLATGFAGAGAGAGVGVGFVAGLLAADFEPTEPDFTAFVLDLGAE
jgi:hypothetical protein